jgi:hypothetical protein
MMRFITCVSNAGDKFDFTPLLEDFIPIYYIIVNVLGILIKNLEIS